MKKEHDKIVQNIAFNLFKKQPYLSLSDLIGEAYLAYSEALKTYDPEKSSINSWIHNNVNLKLYNYISKQQNRLVEESTEFEEIDSINYQYFSPIYDLLESLSPKSRCVCKIIFESPEKYAQAKKPKKLLKEELHKRNWTWSQIYDSFREIKFALLANP